MGDGDTVFALATGRWTGDANVTLVGALAAEAMADAIVRAATQAAASNGLPAARDMSERMVLQIECVWKTAPVRRIRAIAR